ncbi:MAG: tetratricopeptide repeat protein, partial [Rhizomicrobium sp.]
MAQAAVAPGLDSRAGMDAHADTLTKLEKLSEEIDAAQSRRRSNGCLRRAIKNWRRGDIVRAGQLALEATQEDGSNGQAFHVLAMALERMGHLHKALVTYERAFEIDPNDPDLLLNLGLTAWNLKMIEGAERMFRLFIAARPDSPLGYNNLGTIQADQGLQSLAIETLRAALLRMPTEPILWNSLATVLAEDGRADESLVFYQEAIKLDPGFARPWHNLGFAYAHLGRLDEALDAYDHALALAKDPTEILEGRHSRGVCLIGMGRLEEGFRDYETRNSPRFRAYVHHVIKAPVWNGEPLDGKRVLVVGEQGLGDEFMFANILPDIMRAVGPEGKLQICVDPRLVTLFQRSFPAAQVGAYDDRKLISPDGNKELRFIPWAVEGGEPDYYALMGSAIPFFRKRLEDFPHETFLTPDPERVAEFRARLEAIGPGPYVGICWRSMMLGTKRHRYYSALNSWGPILKTPGVTFINVQYGDCRE